MRTVRLVFLNSRFFWMLIFGAALGLLGCAGSNAWGEAPEWIGSRPNVPGYYIGIASASKAQHGESARETAQQRALAELAGQIRVVIESSSILHTTQFQGIAGQNFSERISSTSTEDLEGYEQVGSYENGEEIWAYYRLSQATYERIRAERKNAALNIASGHWTSAQLARSQGLVTAALDGYLRGLESLEDYWGELNLWESAAGTIALDRACIDGIAQVLGGLQLSTPEPDVELSFQDRYSGTVTCLAEFEGQTVGQIPVWYRYNRGTLPKTETKVTNRDGLCEILLNQFDSGIRSSQLRLEVRLSELIPRIQESRARAMIEQFPTPSLSVSISFTPPTVYFRTTEKAKGQVRNQSILKAAIAEGLSAQGVRWVEKEKDADLILTLDADSRDAGSGSGFFTALLNAQVVLKLRDGTPVLQQNLTDVKGVQLNWDAAHDEAYRKAQIEIQGSFLRKLIQALYQ